MRKIAVTRHYDAVYFIPTAENRLKLDQKIYEFYKEHGYLNTHFIPIVDYGLIKHHDDQKRILCVVMNHEIMKKLPLVEMASQQSIALKTKQLGMQR